MTGSAAVDKATALDLLCINTIRTLAMDAVQKANSGHAGTPMALAPVSYVLWLKHLRHHPAKPDWPDRDRFVLSCGHASMLLYALLHLTGYDLPLEELKNFRQWGSKTPGHPEFGLAPGVETTTGPLGQGFGNAVGMALAEAHLAATFNRPGHTVVDHHTYFLASDGDLMEGVSHEAASLAGHLKLGKLIGFYDDNKITIDGSTDLAFSEDVARRFEGYGWHVQKLADGNDLDAIDRATRAAKQVTDQPSLVVLRTHIAFGSPNKQDTAEAHGAPLGEDEVKLTKQNLGWPSLEPFHIPEEALAHWRRALTRGAELEADWRGRWERYLKAYAEAGAELDRRWEGRLPAGWEAALPKLGEAMATRQASGKVIEALAPKLPELIGGSADLATSTNLVFKGAGSFSAEQRAGRNIHFGVREHGMGAVMNGMALHRGVMPVGSTFLIFSDYMRPAIRLAALMEQHVVYVFTHDSIGLGEDGPTHQPIEHLTALRAIPHLFLIRPADAAETVEAWKVAVARRGGPVALVLTRQKVSGIDRAKYAPASGVARGAYVLSEAKGVPAAILMATGSEVEIALKAQDLLRAGGIETRVVSLPCFELFEQQPEAYRREVLPPDVSIRVAIEAAAPDSWHRWVGPHGTILGLKRFGASAPYQRIYQELGLTAERMAERTRALLGR